MRSTEGFIQQLRGSLPAASLRAYMLGVILLATLPLASLMSIQIYRDVHNEQQKIEDELARSAAALAHTVERELASSLEALAMMSRAEPLFVPGQLAASAQRLQPSSDWDSVFLMDRAGALLLDTTAPASPGQPSENLLEIHQRVLRKPEPTVFNQGGAVTIALPVVRRGTVRQVLGARIGETVWQRLASTASTPDGSHAGLYDAAGRLISYSVAAVARTASSLPDEAAESMRGRAFGVHRSNDLDGRLVYAAWQTVPLSGWRVRVSLPAGPIDSAHRSAIIGALSTSGASLLVGVLLASLLAGRIARPLRQLAIQGPAGLLGPSVVEEISLLRDALVQAQARDRAAHDALHAKAQEFETLFSSSPIGIAFAQDPDCSFVWHNPAMDKLIGARGSPAASAVRVLHQGRLLPAQQQPLQRAAALGESISDMELEIATDGRPSTFVIANAVPLRHADGRPRGAISALVNITERKQFEDRLLATDERLRESQRLMELAQEGGHVGFFHYQFQADRLVWTPGQRKLFGLDELPDDTLRAWFDRIDTQDRDRVEREFWTAGALRREAETLEYAVTLPDGRSRWLSSRIMLHYDSQGRASQITGVTVDMTEHKQLERERAQLTESALLARRDAEAASRAKDEFLTMLSHELRNPLGAISAAIDVLDAADPASSAGADARAIIARQTRNLAHMMNDLLDVGRVIAGKILLARQPIDLAALVQRVRETLAVTGEARDHELHLELAEVWIDADAVRIEQVVTNLLTNAIKYTPAGRAIHVTVLNEQGAAVLQVQDAGMGIPAALLPNIFDLFVQGPRTLDRRAGGLGIGLTLVRRLVELHGGSVAVESSDEGSRFTVRLPAVQPPPQPDRHTLPRSRRRKVLVVEDNEDVLSALRSKLELDGHTVTTAMDGIEGLTRLLNLRPEVSIVDIGLPGLTGFELARHARAAGYAGRMIAMSGYSAARDAEEALVSGFDAYLIKPVDGNQLSASLNAE